MAHPTKFRQKGVGYIEVLVSSLILALSLLAALSLYGFSMNMIAKTGDEGVAYNLSRQSIEGARELGFRSKNPNGSLTLPDGSTTLYYDSLGKNESASSFPNAKFKMVRTVASDKTTTFSGGATIPSDDAIRTITVTVYLLPTNEIVEQTGTFLARSGV
jgi:outer membrane lipoprotein-sorting protein